MKPLQNRSVLISAVAGGVIAGALLATRRGDPAPGPAIALPEVIAHLPVPVSDVQPAVIYDAHVEPVRNRRWIAWASAAVAVLLALLALFFSQRPHIAAAAPQRIIAGSPAVVSYGAQGAGSIEATVDTGASQRRYALTGKAGTLTIPAADARAGRDVVATFRMQGWLGADARIVRIAVAAPPAVQTRLLPSNAPVIRALALSAASAPGGSTIVARYASNATGGSVRLTDASGAAWTSVPLRGDGVSAIAVPRVHADTPFIVEIHALRGTQAVVASAGFVAKAAPQVQPGDAATGAPALALPAVLRAGKSITLPLPAALTSATLTLATADGTNLATSQPRTAAGITITVPAMTAPEQAFATLTYQRGKSKETLIRRTTIVP